MKHANPPFRRRALLAATASALALSACESVLPLRGPPPRLYRLTPKSSYPDAQTVDWQLVVEPPSAQASIDTPRIGLMLSPLRFDYYAQANWVDRAPLMVQSLIIESFDNSRAIVAVGRESIGLRPDYVLKSELREFQAEARDNEHRVHVSIHAKLVQMPERQIVSSAEFEHFLFAKPDELEQVISAFDEALGKVLKQIVIWTLEEGEKAEAVRRGTLQSRGQQSGATNAPDQRLTRPSAPSPPAVPRLSRPQSG